MLCLIAIWLPLIIVSDPYLRRTFFFHDNQKKKFIYIIQKNIKESKVYEPFLYLIPTHDFLQL